MSLDSVRKLSCAPPPMQRGTATLKHAHTKQRGLSTPALCTHHQILFGFKPRARSGCDLCVARLGESEAERGAERGIVQGRVARGSLSVQRSSCNGSADCAGGPLVAPHGYNSPRFRGLSTRPVQIPVSPASRAERRRGMRRAGGAR